MVPLCGGLSAIDDLRASKQPQLWRGSTDLFGCLNRPGIFGGSNSQVNWSHDEQDNEQIQS
jgi:hypothetical protein